MLKENYVYAKACRYGCIWPYIHLYSVCIDVRGACKVNPIYSYPESWCMLYLADLATVSHYLTSTQKATVPDQYLCERLPFYTLTAEQLEEYKLK